MFCTTKTCPLLWKYMFIGWAWWKTKSFKNLKVLIFWKKGLQGKGLYKVKDSFKNLFDKKFMFNGFKMFSFKCKSHVKEINMPKNMFGCPLKLILGFSRIFCIFGIKLKYSYTIMYDCEKSPSTHELFDIRLFNFSHLNLFDVNVICKK